MLYPLARRDNMADFSIWAYAVSPTRHAEGIAGTVLPTPAGGPVAANPELVNALNSATARAHDEDWTQIAFRVSPLGTGATTHRSNQTRDLALAVVFAEPREADLGSVGLARRLGEAMDNRSQPHLLVIAAKREDALGEIEMWAFPRDDAFRFQAATQARIELLADVFSRTSRLRKAARFSGEAIDQSFLRGNALDFQTGRVTIDIADYWVGAFLDCTLAVTPVAGTELLADAIRELNRELVVNEDREQLSVAALALRQSPQPSWTLQEVADRLLSPALGQRLLGHSKRPEMNGARFELDHETFDRLIATRVFTLSSGVLVSSPIEQVNESVLVEGDQLRCQGTIVSERMGKRRGRAA
jgi:hypothetical protein